ncbi:radial spoke head protein 9 homolog [Polypterus senegalus]|uniref:radial spoke head protein 9 homolog n=1 Tax=Polypterus senegalus TaxID=55291 RepID=UPI00196322E6|nr:radial spoke head protein 9 homolog [Polypterus senegalus]
MNSAFMNLSLDVAFSIEQKSALQASMVILQKEYKFNQVLFWGKILGIKADYFILKGLGTNELNDKAFLYSLNCMEWFLLPPVSEDFVQNVTSIKGPFVGDLSFEYEYTDASLADEEHTKPEDVTQVLVANLPDIHVDTFISLLILTKVHINEEVRLVAVITLIEREAAVVPRGAYIKDSQGFITVNRMFEGLSMNEAKKLESYLHFSNPVNKVKRSLLLKADYDPSIDFLNSLEDDKPKGTWILQFQKGNSVVLLRSLLWLGLSFYHYLSTINHGYVYVGTGQKNLDFPFMF